VSCLWFPGPQMFFLSAVMRRTCNGPAHWGIFKLGIIVSPAQAAYMLASLLQTYVDPHIQAQLTKFAATLNRKAVPSWPLAVVFNDTDHVIDTPPPPPPRGGFARPRGHAATSQHRQTTCTSRAAIMKTCWMMTTRRTSACPSAMMTLQMTQAVVYHCRQ